MSGHIREPGQERLGGSTASGLPSATSSLPDSYPISSFADVDSSSLRRRRRVLLSVSVVGVALVLAAFGATGYVAYTNKHRADRWESRSEVLERNVSELNSLLVSRSSILNARTSELNRMAAKVRTQETALSRSEADVSSLEHRQQVLANEKAQVEDSRAALAVQAASLETVASASVDCNDGLTDLLGYILDEDYASANAVVAGVADDCDYAESALSAYNANYP